MKVLFLTHAYNYESGTSRHFFRQYEAAHRHPYVEAVLWGIGFPGYKNNKTLRDNVIEKYGSDTYFDLIFLYGMAKTHEISEMSHHTAVMAREHECWDRRCTSIITGNNATLMMFTFAQELQMYSEFSHRVVLMHSPTFAEPEIFYSPVKNNLRDIDVLVIGATDGLIYPIRHRFKTLIENKKIPGYIRKHPGYWRQEWKNEFWEYSGPNMTLVELSDTEVRDYASFAQRAKMCVVCSSVFRYALGKYIELAQAGCLLIGDLPYERKPEFSEFVVDINNDESSDDQIADVVNYWLTNNDEREARAQKGQEIALQYTSDSSVDLIIRGMNLVKKNKYGVYLDYPYQMGCAAQAILPDWSLTQNAWCT